MPKKALLRHFFELYGVPAEAVAFSDNGNSFFDNGESVLKAIGFEDHRCYPANVHQYLSMNDNPLHGTSKGSWRNSGVDYRNQAKIRISNKNLPLLARNKVFDQKLPLTGKN